jgi:type II secretory pathway pseudopilin PulG
MVELMIVVMISGVLASVAIPKFTTARRRATATQLVGDFGVVRHATMSFYVDSGYFPKEAGSGAVPKGLVKYLPNKYTFKKKQWTMDYENWTGKTGKAFVASGIVIGISFTLQDSLLGMTAMDLMGNEPAVTVGKKYTFLISGF